MISVRPRLEEDALDELSTTTFHFANFDGSRLRVRDRLQVMRYVSGAIRSLQPDIVHTHGGTATLAAGGRRATSSSWILDVYDAPGRGRSDWKTDWLEGRMARSSRFLAVTHSRSVQAEVLSKYRVPAERSEFIPLGIDVSAFATPTNPSDVWRAENGLRSDAVVALYVTRVAALKNVDLFLDVAQSVLSRAPRVPVQFVVIGGGSDVSRLEARTVRLGLEEAVRFLGWRPDEDLVNALHSCDMFVSTSDYEGFGLAVAEAMAAGRPVVATAVGGHLDLVQDGRTGLLAPVGDLVGLTNAVETLVQDADTRKRMGFAGAKRIQSDFAADAMVARYEDLYRRLAETTTW